MKFWHRLLVTMAAMLIMGYVAGQIWFSVLGSTMPSYLAGIVGGIVALPVWELLKHIDYK